MIYDRYQCRKWALFLPAISMDAERMYLKKYIVHKPSGTSKAQKVVISGCAQGDFPMGERSIAL